MSYNLAYLAGRGIGEYRQWEVKINGLDMQLVKPERTLAKEMNDKTAKQKEEKPILIF
jgi:hypothetical protein